MITPDLDKIATDLEGLEETIIARLIDRAQFRRNHRGNSKYIHFNIFLIRKKWYRYWFEISNTIIGRLSRFLDLT